MIIFHPIERFEIEGRGTILTGPCPLHAKTNRTDDKTNIRNCVGDKVQIGEQIYRITGVESYLNLPGPRLGDTIGLVVEPWEPQSEERPEL